MSQPTGRSHSLPAVTLAEGWQLQRVTAASRLYGANGLRTGSDSRLYVAQVSGSQISAIDVHTAAVTTVSPWAAPSSRRTTSRSTNRATCMSPRSVKAE